MKRKTAAGIGEILWELWPHGRSLGGAALNFAHCFTALGGKGVVVSTLGADSLGREALRRIQALGLTPSTVTVDPTHPTGGAKVSVDEHGEASYTIFPDAAWDHLAINEAVEELRPQLDAVCFGALGGRSNASREAIFAFLARTRPSTLRVCDLNLRGGAYSLDLLHSYFEASDVVKCSWRELSALAGPFGLGGDEATSLLKLVRRYDLKLAALTRGERGSILVTQDEAADHAGYSVNMVDASGAGDAFCAALTLGLLMGMALEAINDHANRAAAYVCAKAGPSPQLPENLRLVA